MRSIVSSCAMDGKGKSFHKTTIFTCTILKMLFISEAVFPNNNNEGDF